jgi:hypothetical protein
MWQIPTMREASAMRVKLVCDLAINGDRQDILKIPCAQLVLECDVACNKLRIQENVHATVSNELK